jgi:hypothetical protein
MQICLFPFGKGEGGFDGLLFKLDSGTGPPLKSSGDETSRKEKELMSV